MRKNFISNFLLITLTVSSLQMAVAQKVKNAIKKLGGHEYDVGTAADMLGKIQFNDDN